MPVCDVVPDSSAHLFPAFSSVTHSARVSHYKPPYVSPRHVHVRTRLFVRFALAYVIAGAISSRDSRAFHSAWLATLARSLMDVDSPWPIIRWAPVFPLISESLAGPNFMGWENFFFEARALIQGHINLNGLKSIGVIGTRRPGSRH